MSAHTLERVTGGDDVTRVGGEGFRGGTTAWREGWQAAVALNSWSRLDSAARARRHMATTRSLRASQCNLTPHT